VVTITAVADGDGRVLVEAAWTREHEHNQPPIVTGYDPARTLAQQWGRPARGGTEPLPDYRRKPRGRPRMAGVCS